jgi:hypothetical protein
MTAMQAQNIDSLEQRFIELGNKDNIAEKIEICNQLAEKYISVNSDKSKFYAETGIKLAQATKDKESEMKFARHLHVIYRMRAIYDTAKIYNNKMAEIARQTGDKYFESLAVIYDGNMHLGQQHYDSALYYYQKVIPYL